MTALLMSEVLFSLLAVESLSDISITAGVSVIPESGAISRLAMIIGFSACLCRKSIGDKGISWGST